MKYTWWELFKSQYNWKNERNNFIGVFIATLVYTLIVYSSGLKYKSSGDPVELSSVVIMFLFLVTYCYFLTLYHSAKFLFLGVILCGLVTYCCKDDDEELAMEAKGVYDKWRNRL